MRAVIEKLQGPPASDRVLGRVSVKTCRVIFVPSGKATRALGDSHQIEEVGAKLRAMMPWISKNKLVDTAKN